MNFCIILFVRPTHQPSIPNMTAAEISRVVVSFHKVRSIGHAFDHDEINNLLGLAITFRKKRLRRDSRILIQ